jgi:hypothetical protein
MRLIDEIDRDVFECDGWVCVLEVIVVPSMLGLTRKATSLTRVLSILFCNWEENTERWKCTSPRSCYGRWTPET